jgi:hypothetical protein
MALGGQWFAFMVNDFNFSAEDRRRIDLLVDGELPSDQRRELLNRFEHEPAGWRHCALAFLEAQSWRGDFSALLKEPAPEQPVAIVSQPSLSQTAASQPAVLRPVVAPARGSSGSGWLVPLYTLAAAVLVAVGIGLGWRFNPRTSGGGSSIDQFAGSHGASTFNVGRPPVESRRPQPWGNVNLVVDPRGNRADSQVEVPVVEGQELDNRWLRDQPDAVPGDVVRALQQLGNQVHQQRRLVPYRLDDGRNVVVPVDQVDVQPVDMKSFQ